MKPDDGNSTPIPGPPCTGDGLAEIVAAGGLRNYQLHEAHFGRFVTLVGELAERWRQHKAQSFCSRTSVRCRCA